MVKIYRSYKKEDRENHWVNEPNYTFYILYPVYKLLNYMDENMKNTYRYLYRKLDLRKFMKHMFWMDTVLWNRKNLKKYNREKLDIKSKL